MLVDTDRYTINEDLSFWTALETFAPNFDSEESYP